MSAIVLTGTGRDRVGIVAELAETLYDLGCNLLDSSMTLLKGEFAIILMVELPNDKKPADLQARLGTIEKALGLSIQMRELTDAETKPHIPPANLHMISVYGADKTGIVAGITRALANLGANITDVQTTSTTAEDGAANVFVMILEVSTPEALSSNELSNSLNTVGRRLGVNVTVQQIDVVEL